MFLPSGDQSSPPASVAIEVSLCTCGHRSRRAVEIRDPDLRAAFFRREKREALAIRRPARAVGVLIGDEMRSADEDPAELCSAGRPAAPSPLAHQGHDPDVRRLRVGFEIDVDHAEDHPLAVGRNLRIAHALQLHHVVEGEGMLGLGDEREGRRQEREEREEDGA